MSQTFGRTILLKGELEKSLYIVKLVKFGDRFSWDNGWSK